MFDHFNELKNQVAFLLSVRNAAQSKLVGQINTFKTNVLASNELNDAESLRIVVDEIWNSLDTENSGHLGREDMRKFFKIFMPEFRPGCLHTDEVFEYIYAELDFDENGVVEKHEMQKFVEKMLLNHDENDENIAANKPEDELIKEPSHHSTKEKYEAELNSPRKGFEGRRYIESQLAFCDVS